jgi:hypothetical protein
MEMNKRVVAGLLLGLSCVGRAGAQASQGSLDDLLSVGPLARFLARAESCGSFEIHFEMTEEVPGEQVGTSAACDWLGWQYWSKHAMAVRLAKTCGGGVEYYWSLFDGAKTIGLYAQDTDWDGSLSLLIPEGLTAKAYLDAPGMQYPLNAAHLGHMAGMAYGSSTWASIVEKSGRILRGPERETAVGLATEYYIDFGSNHGGNAQQRFQRPLRISITGNGMFAGCLEYEAHRGGPGAMELPGVQGRWIPYLEVRVLESKGSEASEWPELIEILHPAYPHAKTARVRILQAPIINGTEPRGLFELPVDPGTPKLDASGPEILIEANGVRALPAVHWVLGTLRLLDRAPMNPEALSGILQAAAPTSGELLLALASVVVESGTLDSARLDRFKERGSSYPPRSLAALAQVARDGELHFEVLERYAVGSTSGPLLSLTGREGSQAFVLAVRQPDDRWLLLTPGSLRYTCEEKDLPNVFASPVVAISKAQVKRPWLPVIMVTVLFAIAAFVLHGVLRYGSK